MSTSTRQRHLLGAMTCMVLTCPERLDVSRLDFPAPNDRRCWWSRPMQNQGRRRCKHAKRRR